MGGLWGASGYWWAGVAAAAIPVLVHWFRRQQRRKIRWAPMALLQPTVVRRQRRWRLRDAGLLALRIAAMLLIGAALARPRWFGGQALVRGGESSVVLVVVDNSFSMGFTRLGRTTWDRVQPVLTKLLDALPIGTQVCLVPTCVDESEMVSIGYGSASQASERWHELAVLDRAVEPRQVLTRLTEVARLAPAPPEMVYWITDHQRRNFLELGQESWPEELPPLRVVPLDESSPANLWIEDVQIHPEVLVAGDTAEVRVQVGRAGSDLPPQVPIQLWAGDQEIGAQLVPTPVEGSWSTVTFEYRVPLGPESGVDTRVDTGVDTGGPTVGKWMMFRAVLPHDGLPADDQRFAVVSMTAASPLAFTSTASSPAAVGVEDATYYLREFWRSTTAGASASLNSEELLGAVTEPRLRHQPVVVLTGGPPPNDGAVRLLRDYVRRGGQLWIAPDDDFDPVAWNRAAWLDGEGLLPAPLVPTIVGSPVREKVQVDAIRRVDLKSVADRLLGDLPGVSPEALRGLYGEIILLALIAAQETDQSQVLIRTDRGEPLATYRAWGDGGVLFWGTGLRPNWNNMASSSGVICWEHIARFLLSRARRRPQFAPDELPAIRLAALDSSWDWQLVSATDRRPVDAAWRVRPVAKGVRIELDRTLSRGGYLLDGTSRNNQRRLTVPLGVAPAATTWELSESNLTRMDGATWSSLESRWRSSQRSAVRQVAVGDIPGDHAWRAVIVALLACLIVEGLICARLSGGASTSRAVGAVGAESAESAEGTAPGVVNSGRPA